jgi:hypothetical protein
MDLEIGAASRIQVHELPAESCSRTEIRQMCDEWRAATDFSILQREREREYKLQQTCNRAIATDVMRLLQLTIDTWDNPDFICSALLLCTS